MADEGKAPRDWATQPPLIHPDYKSTVLRGPTKPLIPLEATLSELSGPVFGHDSVDPGDADLTMNARVNGEPIGERIIVEGRVLDDAGRPVPNTLIEIWQANAAGRYVHRAEIHDAPLDPNFLGAGRTVTDESGRYRFVTIKPGSYPWGNHHNAWRPAHIHFSLFGPSLLDRLVTQMYFEGDPTFPYDPIFNAVPREAQDLLIAKFSMDLTEPEWAHGYVFDLVLRGPKATPMES
ncbi:MAG: protocatechuate 3,4-dioxygenase subunit beta [Rhizobiales bacterium]|nr:protocatechuate 3,4-dioxygenase subunit beta [Hyphomicrobiales bacterium]